jgi:hypothetical protein
MSSNPLKDVVALAKRFEGLVDIWRAWGGPATGFNQEAGDPPCLDNLALGGVNSFLVLGSYKNDK